MNIEASVKSLLRIYIEILMGKLKIYLRRLCRSLKFSFDYNLKKIQILYDRESNVTCLRDTL